MRNKAIIGVLAVLVLAALGTMLLMPGPDRHLSQKLRQGEAKSYEPPFVKEGELTFFDQETKAPRQRIDIEVVDTEAAITQGLMYRRSMADTVGMLFIFDEMEPRSFWMKNTYISLDILFVDEFNQIVSIQRNTTPLSTRSLPSTGPAQYVIEVVAGFCDRHDIKAGDYVAWERSQ